MIHLKTYESYERSTELSGKRLTLQEYADKFLFPDLRKYFHYINSMEKAFIITMIGGIDVDKISQVHFSKKLSNKLNKTGIFENNSSNDIEKAADGFSFKTIEKIKDEPSMHIGEYGLFELVYDADERSIFCQFENNGEIEEIEKIEDLTNFIHIG